MIPHSTHSTINPVIIASTHAHAQTKSSLRVKKIFLLQIYCILPTVVSHLVVVVGLCTDDPKDF